MKLLIKNKNGFTLVELMIVLVISSIVVVILFSMFKLQSQSASVQNEVAEMQQNLRAGLGTMQNDFYLAGYNPTGSANYGIAKVSVVSDSDSSGTNIEFDFSSNTCFDPDKPDETNEGCAGASEKMTYIYETNDQTISRASSSVILENAEFVEFCFKDEDGNVLGDCLNNDSAAGTKLNATNMGKIKSVGVSILVRTNTLFSENDYSNTTVYTATSDTTIGPFNDGYYRRFLTQQILFRNL